MPNAMHACFRRLLRIILPEGSAQEPRDARPNRSTPDLRRPCELDAGFRGAGSRPCLLCAHRFSADSVMVDAGRLARPRPYARARSDSGKGKNVTIAKYNGRTRSCEENPKLPRRRGTRKTVSAHEEGTKVRVFITRTGSSRLLDLVGPRMGVRVVTNLNHTVENLYRCSTKLTLTCRNPSRARLRRTRTGTAPT